MNAYEALLRYGRHDEPCPKSSVQRAQPHRGTVKCLCGFDDVVKTFEPSNQPTKEKA